MTPPRFAVVESAAGATGFIGSLARRFKPSLVLWAIGLILAQRTLLQLQSLRDVKFVASELLIESLAVVCVMVAVLVADEAVSRGVPRLRAYLCAVVLGCATAAWAQWELRVLLGWDVVPTADDEGWLVLTQQQKVFFDYLFLGAVVCIVYVNRRAARAAALRLRAAELGRALSRRRRSARHSDGRDRAHRGAEGRRLGDLRQRCHRRRHQRHPAARLPRRGRGCDACARTSRRRRAKTRNADARGWRSGGDAGGPFCDTWRQAAGHSGGQPVLPDGPRPQRRHRQSALPHRAAGAARDGHRDRSMACADGLARRRLWLGHRYRAGPIDRPLHQRPCQRERRFREAGRCVRDRPDQPVW